MEEVSKSLVTLMGSYQKEHPGEDEGPSHASSLLGGGQPNLYSSSEHEGLAKKKKEKKKKSEHKCLDVTGREKKIKSHSGNKINFLL